MLLQEKPALEFTSLFFFPSRLLTALAPPPPRSPSRSCVTSCPSKGSSLLPGSAASCCWL